jgi:excisionase family DNA binding protein
VAKRRKRQWAPHRPVSQRSEALGETLYTAEEAADYLGVQMRWFNQESSREIARTKIGGHLRFRRADLDAYIEKQRVPAEQ